MNSAILDVSTDALFDRNTCLTAILAATQYAICVASNSSSRVITFFEGALLSAHVAFFAALLCGA